jgi:hypothetical protein
MSEDEIGAVLGKIVIRRTHCPPRRQDTDIAVDTSLADEEGFSKF